MKSLATLLTSYIPHTAREQQSCNTILNFIETHEDAFERTLLIGHITASALLLNTTKTHFLLMHHKKLNKWLQLGGHCDGNKDVIAVAVKEAQEESGIIGIEPLSTEIFDIDIHDIPEHKGVPAHIHYDIRFLLRTTASDAVVKNSESNALQWFSFNDPLPTTEPSVLRMINKVKRLL